LTLRKSPTVACPFPGGGADGICVQTLDELSSLTSAITSGWGTTWTPSNHGIVDVLLTNSVVGVRKISRFRSIIEACKGKANVSLLCDDIDNLRNLNELLPSSSFGVFVEVNVGQNRGGITPTTSNLPNILELVKEAGSSYRGLHCYHGLLQHVNNSSDRVSQVMSTSVKSAREVKTYLTSNGVDPGIITGGGTGTYFIEGSANVHTEVQPGSFLLGDTEYGDVEMAEGAPTFEHACWINTGVCSVASTSSCVVVDAGSKAVDLVAGKPSVTNKGVRMGFTGKRDEEVRYSSGGDDHGVLTFEEGRDRPGMGESVRMVPRHIDPNVNLFDWIVVVEEGEKGEMEDGCIKGTWRITGRGVGC
jgi:D-serine deaminase-like pyridoxal phosphate-dependent protein